MEDVLQALREVKDPELGINIVDLGLVCRAEHGPEGVAVALTPSSPTCPLSELIVAETREALRAHFPDARSIAVELVRDPPWSPDRMSAEARRLLG